MKSPFRETIKYIPKRANSPVKSDYCWIFLLLFFFSATNMSMAADSFYSGIMRPTSAFKKVDTLDSWLICALEAEPLVTAIYIPPMPNQIPDLPGTIIPWTPIVALQQVVEPKLLKSPDELPNNVLFFAYSNHFSATARNTQLQLTSDGAITIWLNGIPLKIKENNCLINVSLLQGNNSLLVRIKPTISGCRFALALLPNWSGNITTLPGKQNDAISIYPQLSSYKQTLTVRSDYGPSGWSTREQVNIEVFAPGWRRVAQGYTTRGANIKFNTALWPEGPYEIRATLLSPQPFPTVGHATWYNGDLLPAVTAILKDEAVIDNTTIMGMKRQLLINILHDRLGKKPTRIPSEEQKTVISLMLEWQGYELDEQGENGTLHANGMVRLAYRDDVDNSPQFARAFLPASYDSRQEWPLVIMLHGMRGSNPPYESYVAADRRTDVFADRFNTIMLYPFGRGNTFYQGIGDADVMHMIKLTQETLNIDKSRIYLVGYSMGGAGCWHIGSHYPEIFAAIAPLYGGREYRVTSSASMLRNLSASEQYRLERLKSSFANLESLLSTPTFVNHGTNDTTVPIAISRYGVSLLQRWEYDIRYWEHPGKGHVQPLGCENEIFGWLLDHRLKRFPAEVRIRASDLRYAAAHWARIVQRERPGEMMELRARFFAPNALRLETENITSVKFTLPAELIDREKPLTILWNKRKSLKIMAKDGIINLSSDESSTNLRQKNAACEGPISDIYNTPFALVRGTISPDQTMNEACKKLTTSLQQRWEKSQHWLPRTFDDRKLTRQQLDDYSLILIGGPNENAISAQIASRIPLTIAKDAITLGEEKVRGADLAVQMIRPNPYNPARYVLLLAANSPEAMPVAIKLPDDVDFAVGDGKESPWLMMGFFATDWSYDKRYIENGCGWR